MTQLTETTTLREAKDFLNDNLDRGCICPACEQTCKRYVRKLTSSMAYGLYLINKLSKSREDQWIHIENEFKQMNVPSSIRGDLPKLRYWGLIEKRDQVTDDGNPCSGYYRITKKGEDFINGLTTTRAKVKLYNNQFYGYEGAFLTFREALTNKFQYDELMKGESNE